MELLRVEGKMKNIERLLYETEDKILAQAERLGSSIPYIPENGHYVDMAERDIAWWTNGFWPGMLWLTYVDTKNEIARKAAESIESKLDRALDQFTGLHHDVGFMWRHSAAADYDITSSSRSCARAMHAATILAGRFNPETGAIRSWNEGYDGYVIIDSLMNLPLLFWMSERTKNPSFSNIARIHATTVLRTHQKKDGHVIHIAKLDEHGNVVETPTGQGYSEGSAWSRGQSWGIYGFALAYRHTNDKKFLDGAIAVADYYINEVKKTGYIPKVDFCSPKEDTTVDTTSALCAVCGLLELAEHIDGDKALFYKENAEKILFSTIEKWCDFDKNNDGILSGGTAAYYSDIKEVKIIYGDYFLLEALLRLNGRYSYRMW